MNLHSIVRGHVTAINPDVDGILTRQVGYSTNPDGSRESCSPIIQAVRVQRQELTQPELKQLEGLNIQSVDCAVYLNGNIYGTSRPDQSGGDILEFDGQKWLVVHVFESWRVGWCKVGLCLQR